MQRYSWTKKAWMVLALLACGTCWCIGLSVAKADPAAPPPAHNVVPCTISCICKEVVAYLSQDPPAASDGPYVWLLDAPGGGYSVTRQAMEITTTGGCMAGSPTAVPGGTCYKLKPYGNPVCEINGTGIIEHTYSTTATFQTTIPLVGQAWKQCQ